MHYKGNIFSLPYTLIYFPLIHDVLNTNKNLYSCSVLLFKLITQKKGDSVNLKNKIILTKSHSLIISSHAQ